MKRVFKEGIFPSDIGCYTLGLQMGAVDTTICMGASISIGSGISHACPGVDVVSTIGDSTFLHSGLNGLINSVYNNANQTIVILDNRITAMTGHQPNPNTGLTAIGTTSPKISLEALVRACGISFVESVDPYDLPALIDTFQTAKKTPGVKVIIAKQGCAVMLKRNGIKLPKYTVEPTKCVKCKACIKYGCPAIEINNEGCAKITNLCNGCGVCSDICPAGAIVKEGARK